MATHHYTQTGQFGKPKAPAFCRILRDFSHFGLSGFGSGAG